MSLSSKIILQNMSISHTKRQIFKEHRNSCPKMFCKKGFLRNFTKFTGKHLCQSLYFIKTKEILAQVFSCEICENSKNTFSYRTPPVAASKSTEFRCQLTPKCQLFFVLSRAPQIPRKKYTSEHPFYRTAPSGCF